ncbi:MAG: M28 family peptidase [Solirubrobacterales bacterium]
MASSSSPLTPKLLFWALGFQIVLGGLLVWQASEGFSLFRGDDGGGQRSAPPAAVAPAAPKARVDRFDADRAMDWARRQVELGPRPAGSPAQRQAAELLRAALPDGRFVGLGPTDPSHPPLRNIEGALPGRGKPILLVAHYDTTPVPGYVGANNSAAGVGAVMELARTLRRHPPRSGRPVHFLLTDGEEAPEYPPKGDFYEEGLRGSKFAARTSRAGQVIVLDFVAQKDLRIPRELGSDAGLWRELRAAARRVGVARVFPDATRGEILDDHTPFARRGIPAIDLIDFDYPCWQQPCDTMDKLDVRSLDAAGETVAELVRTLG